MPDPVSLERSPVRRASTARMLGSSLLIAPFLRSSERLPPGALPPAVPAPVEVPLPPSPRASLPGSFGSVTGLTTS